MPQRKIATCCYCGARATLVLTGRDRHELSCASCGAPLHDLKMLKVDHAVDRRTVRPSPLHDWTPPPEGADHAGYRAPSAPPRRRRRKGVARWFLEEAFDLIEDIID